MKIISNKIFSFILLLSIGSMLFCDPGDTVIGLDGQNAKNYLNPLSRMFGAGMNSGYFRKASSHNLKRIDITVDIVYAMIPDQLSSYNFVVPDTPVIYSFPFKFPKSYLNYSNPILLDYIPGSDTEGMFYEKDIEFNLPLSTLLVTRSVPTIIGDSNNDTLFFDFGVANTGSVLYEQIIAGIWSEIENVEGIGAENPYFVFDANDSSRVIAELPAAFDNVESFITNFATTEDLLGTLDSTLNSKDIHLIIPGGFDYLFKESSITGLPLPILQISQGFPYHSEITFRCLPETSISSFGSIKYAGIGGKIEITEMLSNILDFAPRYEKKLDIMSYTNIFSQDIKPEDVDKAINDFKKLNLDVQALDSLNTLFKEGNSEPIKKIQDEVQNALNTFKEMPKAYKDVEENQLPFDLSLGLYTSYYKLNMGGPEITATNNMISLQLGKSYITNTVSWLGEIGIYGGLGFEISNSDLYYKYTNTLGESSDISLNFTEFKTLRGLVGARVKIFLVDAYLDYNLGSVNTFNVGLGITL